MPVMQNGASLGLFLSPISPVMVGVAGVAHIKSVDLLKEQLGYMEQYSSVLKRRIETIRLKE